jgi:hypothetical protein
MEPTRMPTRDDNQGVRALRALAGALSRAAGTPLLGKTVGPRHSWLVFETIGSVGGVSGDVFAGQSQGQPVVGGGGVFGIGERRQPGRNYEHWRYGSRKYF